MLIDEKTLRVYTRANPAKMITLTQSFPLSSELVGYHAKEILLYKSTRHIRTDLKVIVTHEFNTAFTIYTVEQKCRAPDIEFYRNKKR